MALVLAILFWRRRQQRSKEKEDDFLAETHYVAPYFQYSPVVRNQSGKEVILSPHTMDAYPRTRISEKRREHERLGQAQSPVTPVMSVPVSSTGESSSSGELRNEVERLRREMDEVRVITGNAYEAPPQYASQRGD